MSSADDGRSLGQLVASATAELSGLVHDEIALAKAEIRQDVKRGIVGGGAATAAGVLLLFSLPVLSFAAAYGIHNLGLGLAWSFLIVGGAYIFIALVLLLLALRKFKRIKPPEKSIASAKQTASVLSRAKPHPRTATGKGTGAGTKTGTGTGKPAGAEATSRRGGKSLDKQPKSPTAA